MGHTGYGALGSRSNRFPLYHGVDRKVLSNVAQKADYIESRSPLQVVCYQRRVVARKFHKTFHLTTNPAYPITYHLERVQAALINSTRWIPNHARSTPQEQDWPMPMQLKTSQRDERNEITDVQTVGGGVKTAIKGARASLEMLSQPCLVRDLRDQPARVEIIDEPHAHFTACSQRRAPYQKAADGSTLGVA